MVTTTSREKGVREAGGSRQRGVGVGMKRDFSWGDGHMNQYTDDVLLGCTLKMCALENKCHKN